MSYSEHAQKLNNRFRELGSCASPRMVNAILEFGRVAKYRCRHNTAYANFAREVFNGIVDIREERRERTRDGGSYTVLVAEGAKEQEVTPASFSEAIEARADLQRKYGGD